MEEVTTYIIERDIGDIILYGDVYLAEDGTYYIRKTCVYALPFDVTDQEMDVNEWFRVELRS